MRQREAQKHWRKRISGRACPHCRTDLPADYDGKKVCPSCLAKIVADRKDRVAKGLCCKCSAPAAVGKKWPRCLDCWWKGQSTAHTGTVRNADALKSLWESQGRRCFYTGKPLTPGVNMWLDHSKPRSRGGDSAFENLRWVTKRANLAKNDCTHEEFLALCRLVAGRFPNA